MATLDANHSARLRAALLVALFTIALGVMGIAYPDVVTAARRSYYATPGRFYGAGAIRLAMGITWILAASRSRWPRILLALGVVMCLQAFSGTLMGPWHARTIMEWESMHPALLRLGAVVALLCGSLVAFAVTMRTNAAPS